MVFAVQLDRPKSGCGRTAERHTRVRSSPSDQLVQAGRYGSVVFPSRPSSTHEHIVHQQVTSKTFVVVSCNHVCPGE